MRRLFAVCFLFLLVGGFAHAQVPNVSIQGTAADVTGAVIPGAVLTLTNKVTTKSQTTTSDAAGGFTFSNVASGDYVLRGAAKEFADTEVKLTVVPQSVTNLTVTLKAAAKSEEVTVNGSSKEEELSVTMERNADRLNFDDNMLRGLPAAGQNPLGVLGSFLSPAAQGGEGLNLMIDGVEASAMNLPAGALRRARINRNPYAAEFRRPGKARIEILTEEGSDRRYRGRFSVYARNAAFDARNAFAGVKPDLSRYVIETNIGGPLVKKRANFFVSGERFINNEFAVVNARTLSGAVNANVATPERRTNLLGRVETRIGKANTLLMLYSFLDQAERNRGVGGLRLAEQGVTAEQRNHRFQLSDRMILSSRWLNDVRVVFERERRQTGALANGPALIVQGAFTGGVPQSFRTLQETAVRLSDTASYARGRHALKFGGELRPVWYEATEASNFGGTYEFADLPSFAINSPFVYRVNRGTPTVKFKQPEAAAFVQDEIKVRQNLSITPGVRYGWQGNVRDRNNVAPRLGFAYAPGNRKTVIRGGAGIFHERVSEEVRRRSQLYDGVRLSEFVLLNPAFPATLTAVNAAPPSVILTAGNLRNPYVVQASVSVERELKRGTNLAVEYQTLRGRKLLRSRNLNAPRNGVRPDATRLNINQVESSASSCSNALSVTLRGAAGKYLSGMAQYTYSRSYDDTVSAFGLPADNANLQPEWGRADYDQRHRLNLAGTLDLPKGLRFGAFVSVGSGVPYNITTGRDNNGDSVANDRPVGIGRNTGEGPGFAQVDLRVTKLLRVPRLIDRRSESNSRNLELSVDFFNLFNKVNYQNFIGVQSSPFYGRANAARTPRTIQFSTRYKF